MHSLPHTSCTLCLVALAYWAYRLLMRPALSLKKVRPNAVRRSMRVHAAHAFCLYHLRWWQGVVCLGGKNIETLIWKQQFFFVFLFVKDNKTLQLSKSFMKPMNPLACVNTERHVRKKPFVAFSSPTWLCPFVAFDVFNSVYSFSRSPWRPPPQVAWE